VLADTNERINEMSYERKMRRITGILMGVLAVLISFSVSMTEIYAAEDVCDVTVTVKYGQTEARSMLEMVNSFRAGSDAWYWNKDNTTKTVCSGLSALTYDYELEKIAMQRAAEIALSFSHTRTDGTSCFYAYKENEFVYIAAGENIAAGYTSASSVYNGWREDNDQYSGQGHRRNMLSSSYNVIGIGHVYYNGCHYWVQEFAYTNSPNSTPTAANDSYTAVNLSLSAAKTYDVSLSDTLTDITMKCGETREADSISASFYVTESFPTNARKAVVSPMLSSDNAAVEISGNQIKALTAGEFAINASYLGQTVEFKVNVSHEYDSGKIVSEATYTQTGIMEFTCKGCSATKQVELPVLVENGWRIIDGKEYWYENGVLQGYKEDDPSYRGKEIYDSSSDAWYWLDNVAYGAKAVSKDVYQESEAGIWGYVLNADGTRSGKWVRYDENGHMIKGWSTDASGSTYYFDEVYGTMAKGYCTIDGVEYFFNATDGRLERVVTEDIAGYNGWKEVEGKAIWYEDGIRQGYSINSSYRGKEIYDAQSDAWYWLDNIQDGAKAVSKDVYQESGAGIWGDVLNADGTRTGKWVRYDENGHMIKGWVESDGCRFYFDPVYGTMAKGSVTIEGLEYYFDIQNGILN
jgi:uncharacterized protein YkwD/glucan-binding YG repeat protein